MDARFGSEKGMATHSSILAWIIPRTGEPGGLQSMELWRVRHNWTANTFTFSLLPTGIYSDELKDRIQSFLPSKDYLVTSKQWIKFGIFFFQCFKMPFLSYAELISNIKEIQMEYSIIWDSNPKFLLYLYTLFSNPILCRSFSLFMPQDYCVSSNGTEWKVSGPWLHLLSEFPLKYLMLSFPPKI